MRRLRQVDPALLRRFDRVIERLRNMAPDPIPREWAEKQELWLEGKTCFAPLSPGVWTEEGIRTVLEYMIELRDSFVDGVATGKWGLPYVFADANAPPPWTSDPIQDEIYKLQDDVFAFEQRHVQSEGAKVPAARPSQPVARLAVNRDANFRRLNSEPLFAALRSGLLDDHLEQIVAAVSERLAVIEAERQ